MYKKKEGSIQQESNLLAQVGRLNHSAMDAEPSELGFFLYSFSSFYFFR